MARLEREAPPTRKEDAIIPSEAFQKGVFTVALAEQHTVAGDMGMAVDKIEGGHDTEGAICYLVEIFFATGDTLGVVDVRPEKVHPISKRGVPCEQPLT